MSGHRSPKPDPKSDDATRASGDAPLDVRIAELEAQLQVAKLEAELIKLRAEARKAEQAQSTEAPDESGTRLRVVLMSDGEEAPEASQTLEEPPPAAKESEPQEPDESASRAGRCSQKKTEPIQPRGQGKKETTSAAGQTRSPSRPLKKPKSKSKAKPKNPQAAAASVASSPPPAPTKPTSKSTPKAKAPAGMPELSSASPAKKSPATPPRSASRKPSEESLPAKHPTTEPSAVTTDRVDSEPDDEASTATAPVDTQLELVESPGLSIRTLIARRTPAWLISMIVHVAIVVLLALLTISLPKDDGPKAILVSSSDDVEQIEEIDAEELEFDAPVLNAPAVDFNAALELGDVGNLNAVDVGDIGAAEVGVASIGDVDGLGDIGDIGSLGEIGGGKGKASFFGVTVQGNRFCYVVDNSNSMSGGKFETACYELARSVSALGENQMFYIIFYSDTAYPLFYPQSAPRYVRATDENKRKTAYWLDTVHRCLQTRGEEAMEGALRLRPDVIFLLGDGAFTDKTADKILAMSIPNLTIHTMGFSMRAKDAEVFGKIAAKFKGKFTEVAVTPAMKAREKQMNRPKNNSRNGVWGIKLGEKKKRPKKKK